MKSDSLTVVFSCANYVPVNTAAQPSGLSLQRLPRVAADLFQKGIVQIPAEAPESSHIILHILGWNYWKFYINISYNGIFVSCGLQKTRRSLDLDKTTVLSQDPANQQYIQWPLFCKESTNKYLCTEIKCFTNTVRVSISGMENSASWDNAAKSTSFTAFPFMSERCKVQKGLGYFSIFLHAVYKGRIGCGLS